MSTIANHIAGRRRKKSCIPRSATPGTCEECYTRKVQCRDQQVSLGTKRRPQQDKDDLQQRVAELETALLSISEKLDTTPGTIDSENGAAEALQRLRSGHSSSTAAESIDAAPDSLLKHAPILSLFDNALLSRRPDDSIREDSNGTAFTTSEATSNSNLKLDSIRRTLKSLFPSRQRQAAILDTSLIWMGSWQDIYPQIFGIGPHQNTALFVEELKASDNVQKLTKALLCIFSVLQEGHSNDTSPDATRTAGEISHGLAVIDELVLNDDELAGTVDGIECTLLRAKCEVNYGRIRKGWLTFRRGISLAQLLGLHKRPTTPNSDASQTRRRESLWKALYSSDRFLSLMLGLPYGPSEIHADIGRDSEAYAKGIRVQDTSEHYFTRLSNIVGHIVDRNQQLPSNNMLPLTFKIEAELMELSASMTSDWWEPNIEPGGAAKRIYSQLLPQFWHHQSRALLHLPFMLKATTDRLFEYNKIATLESAREMIECYRVIRPAQGYGSLICRMLDFQVFTAAMILVINLIDHYRKTETDNNSEADNDQHLINVTTDILRRASTVTDVVVATQAARALEMFAKIKETSLSAGRFDVDCTTKLVVPYFGTVVFGPGTSLKDRALNRKPEPMFQPQQLPTPSEQSLDGFSPEAVPPSSSAVPSTIPFELNYRENRGGTSVNGDLFANVNFDLDQDWSWFWDNIDVPSMDMQGTMP